MDPPLQTLLKHASVPNELIKKEKTVSKKNSNPPFLLNSQPLLLYYSITVVWHTDERKFKGVRVWSQ